MIEDELSYDIVVGRYEDHWEVAVFSEHSNEPIFDKEARTAELAVIYAANFIGQRQRDTNTFLGFEKNGA